MLNFAMFEDQQYGGNGIAYSWQNRARQIQRNEGRNFERFMCLWLAFNAWGMCVTLASSDRRMIDTVAGDRQVARVFDQIVGNCNSIVEDLRKVEPSFPLPNFSDLLRLDPKYNWRGPRDDAYWRKIERAAEDGFGRVKRSPALRADNLNWSDTLNCIYQVRCNLIHGGKQANPDEEEFVGVFADLLDLLMSNGRTHDSIFYLRAERD